MTSNASINLYGNLVADPELKTAGNSKLVEFRMAVSTSAKNSNGDYITNFYRVARFGSDAELNNFMSAAQKGTGVVVSGLLAVTEYNKRDGGAGYTLEVTANKLIAVTRTKNANGTPSAQAAPAPKQTSEAEDPDAMPF